MILQSESFLYRVIIDYLSVCAFLPDSPRPLLRLSLDPLQFAFQAQPLVDDAITQLLHSSSSHLDDCDSTISFPPLAFNSILLPCRGLSRGRCRWMPLWCPGLQTLLPTGRGGYHSRGHLKAPSCYLSFVFLSPIWASRRPTLKTDPDESSAMGFNIDENKGDFRKCLCRFILVIQVVRCQTQFKTTRWTGN